MNTTYNVEIIVRQDKYGVVHYFVGRDRADNSIEWNHNPIKALQFDRDDSWELSELLRELNFLTDWYAKHCPEEGVKIFPKTLTSH